jgi:tRNA acetyltransferase TAN1
MYGLPTSAEQAEQQDDSGGKDIAASIEEELSSIKAQEKPKTRQIFTPVSVNIECVFFMKTMKPVEPDRLVRRICEDAKSCADPRQRRTKYINRLTPVTDTDKASENGIQRVARKVMEPWFALKPEEDGKERAEDGADGDVDGSKTCTVGCIDDCPSLMPVLAEEVTMTDAAESKFAIRHVIRSYNTLKSDAVIKMIASLVKPQHKVNLSNPDKVVLVEIFQVSRHQQPCTARQSVDPLYLLTRLAGGRGAVLLWHFRRGWKILARVEKVQRQRAVHNIS